MIIVELIAIEMAKSSTIVSMLLDKWYTKNCTVIVLYVCKNICTVLYNTLSFKRIINALRWDLNLARPFKDAEEAPNQLPKIIQVIQEVAEHCTVPDTITIQYTQNSQYHT